MAVHSYKDFLYIRIYLELYMLNKAAFKKIKTQWNILKYHYYLK